MNDSGTESRIRALNSWYWEDLAQLHQRKCARLADDVVGGYSTLRRIELQAAGDVRTKQLLHLMCHLGFDSINWARLGAHVVAVDASRSALCFASQIAERAGVAVEFERLSVPSILPSWRSRFDAVVMTYGTLAWLPDLRAWAESCAACLAPGGRLIVVDDHPLGDSVRPSAQGETLVIDQSVADEGAGVVRRHRTSGSYVDRLSQVTTPVHYRWHHSISNLTRSITGAGLEIVDFHDFPFTHYKRFPHFVLRSDRYYEPSQAPPCPLMFSLLAKKAA